ncbi:MAG TPA: LysR family transcriptional regulator [Methylomirabilota bacterium]|nr:LysR family transcriptional regulator [Methylomirabilota bacterium]
MRDLRRFVWELDWNLLRTFTVIVQARSITGAGERLGLMQPSVSNALRRLERHLDCQLIDRRPGRFDLTPAGDRLYDECLVLFGGMSGLYALVHDHEEDIAGHIDIALASHVVCPFFDDVLAAFHRDHPKVTFFASVAPSRDIVRAVMLREVAFGVGLPAERHPQLEYAPLYREMFGFYCGRTHRLFGRRDLDLSDLRDEAYVAFKTDQLGDALRPVALLRERERFQGPTIGMSSHLEEVKRMIASGFGFGALPLHVVEQDVAAGTLWRLPPYERPPAVDVLLVTDPSARRQRAEELLIERLRTAMAAVPIAQRTYPPPARA